VIENDDLEELASEIRRLIESNKVFLERVNDEEYEDESEETDADADAEEDLEDYEEL
jgi:hypothetical protein